MVQRCFLSHILSFLLQTTKIKVQNIYPHIHMELHHSYIILVLLPKNNTTQKPFFFLVHWLSFPCFQVFILATKIPHFLKLQPLLTMLPHLPSLPLSTFHQCLYATQLSPSKNHILHQKIKKSGAWDQVLQESLMFNRYPILKARIKSFVFY